MVVGSKKEKKEEKEEHFFIFDEEGYNLVSEDMG